MRSFTAAPQQQDLLDRHDDGVRVFPVGAGAGDDDAGETEERLEVGRSERVVDVHDVADGFTARPLTD